MRLMEAVCRSRFSRGAATLAVSAVMVTVGCKTTTPTVDDATLTATVQGRIQNDSALRTEPIQVYTQSGAVTLNGQVSNDAARTLAANDAAGVTGVQKVINNLVVASNTPPVSALSTTPQPQIAPEPVQRVRAKVQPERASSSRSTSPERNSVPVERSQPYVPPASVAAAPPPSAAPAAPSFRNVTVPAGTTIPVRITQTLDSATTQTGDTFSGAVATDIVEDGVVVLPRGTSVSGRVIEVKEASHFKGSSLLSIELTNITRRGQQIAVSTEPFSKEGAGRGKNTAVKTGVGAAAGAVLGGIFGGGKGAAIGAAAGGGTGAGINAVTRGQQVQIPSETVVRFSTTNSFNVRASTSDSSGQSSHPSNY